MSDEWGTVEAAKAKERAKIFHIINEISVSDDIGELVYLSDLHEYLEEADGDE
jgi:hypothetical protein